MLYALIETEASAHNSVISWYASSAVTMCVVSDRLGMNPKLSPPESKTAHCLLLVAKEHCLRI